MPRRLRATTLCALWAWLWLSVPARAEPLRAALRMAEPADSALLARIRGQTGDLDVAIDGVATDGLEQVSTAQLEAARKLADERGLRVIVWAARDAQGLHLWVADFALDRVLVRELAGGALDRSAQEEAAALVTRSALRASLSGSALGRPSEQVVESARDQLVARVEPPQPLPSPAPPVLPPPSSVKESWQPDLELGVLSGSDGTTKRGHHALTLRAGLRYRRLELALVGGFGLPTAVDAALAKLTLAAHRAEGSIGAAWLARGSWRLSSALAAGVQVLGLHAEARTANLQAQDARAVLPSLSAYARALYRPSRWPIGIAIRVGLDVLPMRPELGYQSAEGFTRVHALWHAQPQLGLGLTAF